MTSNGQKMLAFNERFAELLDGRPESATELAKKMNVSKQTISAWKCGKRHPNKMASVAIAKFFGVNIDWLYGFDVEKEAKNGSITSLADESNNSPRTEEARIISNGVDKLPPEQREKLLNIFNDLFEIYSKTESKGD